MVEVERAGFARTSISVNVAGPGQTRVSIQLKVVGPGQQVIVTAELSSFRTDESSTATKMSIPINEIPPGVGVVNQSLIQSQQDIRFGDAAENISGVNRDVLAAGDLGSALTIRGLPLGVFSNYYRDGFTLRRPLDRWLKCERQRRRPRPCTGHSAAQTMFANCRRSTSSGCDRSKGKACGCFSLRSPVGQ